MAGKRKKPDAAPVGPWEPGVMTGLEDRLIPQQDVKVIEGMLEGKSPKQAVIDAGRNFSPRSAKAYGEHVKRKYFDANGALMVSLERVGIDPDYIVNKVKSICEAKKQLPVKKIKTKSDTLETEEIIYTDVEDFHAQHKGVNTLLDIIPGARAPKQLEITQTTFEQKVALHADIMGNPGEAMNVLRDLIDRKNKTIDAEVADGGNGVGQG